jgi:hypothetical protein
MARESSSLGGSKTHSGIELLAREGIRRSDVIESSDTALPKKRTSRGHRYGAFMEPSRRNQWQIAPPPNPQKQAV